MFESLAGRFNDILTRVKGRGRIDENDVEEAGRQIKLALLEADVNYKVVKDLVASIKAKAVGEEVLRSITPAQQVVKIVQDELTAVMGGEAAPLRISGKRPDTLMLVGLQGSGKTTAAAKLALRLKKDGMRALLVAADIHRPAAIAQLKTLGAELDVDVFTGGKNDTAPEIAAAAVKSAAGSIYDAVIIDTAGRNQVDKEMMNEVAAIRDKIRPGHVLFVADSMLGQDAVNQANAFNELLDFEGVILTKLDGDARGGAALSIKHETGKPVMFVSTGEKTNEFEVFHPERMASRILGMGDVVSLVEKAQENVDQEEAERVAARLLKDEFTLDDFLTQLEQIRKMGGLNDMIGMLPKHMMPKQMRGADVDETGLVVAKAVIQSMTSEERRNPKLINGSRRARIAAGSGTGVADVNALLKQFEMMRKMMKSMKGGKRRLPFPTG